MIEGHTRIEDVTCVIGHQDYCTFHSIWQVLWHVTTLPKFWFWQLQILAVTRLEIWQYGAAGHKILLFETVITKWFWHWKKMACYKHYISAILKAAWCVTAKLNEIVQYEVKGVQ